MKSILFSIIFILVMNSFLAANTRIDSLSNELNTRSEADQIEIYNLLAEAHWYIAPDKTIELAETALDLAEKHNNKEQKSLALINIGNGYMFTGNFQEALENYLKPGLELAEEINFEKGIAGGLNSVAATYMNLGNYQQALNTFMRSLEILERNEDYNKAARIKINIAALYSNWGNYDIAMEYYFDALEIFERVGDKDLLSRTLNNIAVAYHGWGNYDKALEFYNQSLILYDEQNDELGKAIPLNNIGEIYKDRGNYDTALEYYLQALDLVLESNNKQSIGVALQGTGEAFKGLEDYDLATDYLLQALDNFSEIGFQEGIANSFYELGDIHLIKNDNEKALDYFVKSLELSEASNIMDLMKDNYLSISEVYSNLENHEASLEHYKLYSAINDSIFTKETNNRITELDFKYNTAKKEQEIVLLTKLNKIQRTKGIFLLVGLLLIFIILVILFMYYRTKAKSNKILRLANAKIQKQKNELEIKNKELNELNATKNKFFSIVAHDLKNAFISQLSGSKLLSKDIDSLDSETIKTVATELNKSAENLYELLQNLLDWSRIQMQRIEFKLEEIVLEDFVKLKLPILTDIASRKSITLNYNIDSDLKIIADRNMLRSILQSLINNSIKFSTPNTTVNISAIAVNGKTTITVEDEGVGIEAADLDRLFRVDKSFSTAGTANEKGTGLGLILCKEFVELHNGSISIDSVKNKGTKVVFEIPSI